MKTTKLLLASFAIAAVFAQSARAAWTPPDQPDPSKILQEAQADATAGHYEDALAKQVWFHQNALKYQPSQYGVRLSFALSAWAKLGESYPPALETLKGIRDQADGSIRKADKPQDAFQSFVDFAAINKTIHEDDKTSELFLWLDSTKPAVAQKVFERAEPSLIKAKQFKLCGKYIDPKNSFDQVVKTYKQNKQLADNPQIGKQFQAFAEKNFTHSTSVLVALLALNDQQAEADRIATEATKELDNPGFRQQLAEAQKGVVPPAWP